MDSWILEKRIRMSLDQFQSFILKDTTVDLDERNRRLKMSYDEYVDYLLNNYGMDLDYDILFGMTYDEYVNHLLNKYGNVLGDYYNSLFLNKINHKISRSTEGLYIHHIDEDKYPGLCKRDGIKYAPGDPYYYHKAERLVYCNIVEHTILHMKIVEKELSKPDDEREYDNPVGFSGFVLLAKNINRILDAVYNEKFSKNFTKLDCLCADMMIGWWTTVFLETIKYFVENIESRTDFIEWYGNVVI